MKYLNFKLAAKLFSVFIAFSFFIFSITSFLLILSNLPQKYAKQFLDHYLSDTMGMNISFQTIRGNLYDSITIKNINGYDSAEPDRFKVISIDTLSIQYNIFKLIFFDNKINAVNHIYVSDAEYYIIRDKEGKFRNIATKPSEKQRNFDFQGSIYLNNITVYYKDHKGWKEVALANPFQKKIRSINGSIQFDNQGKGDLIAKGFYDNTQNPCDLSGHFFFSPFDFTLFFKTNNLLLSEWGPYAVPAQGYATFSGQTAIDGYITNKKFPTSSKNKIWYDIDFNLQNATFKTPYLDPLITSANGVLTIQKGVLSSDYLNSLQYYISPYDSNNISNTLLKHNVVNQLSVLTPDALSNITSLKAKDMNDDIVNILKPHIQNPGFNIHFKSISSNVSSINAVINGTINFKDEWLELAIDGPAFDSQKLPYLFKGLKPLNLSQDLVANLQIFGRFKSPILKGSASSSHLKCLGYDFYNVDTTFKFHKDIFSLVAHKSTFFDSPLVGSVTLKDISSAPLMSIEGHLSQSSLPVLIPNLDVSGNIDVSTSLYGPYNNLSGDLYIVGNDLVIQRQSIEHIYSKLFVSKDQIAIHSKEMMLNNRHSLIDVSTIFKNNTIELITSCNNLMVVDPFSSITSPGTLSLHSSLIFSPTKDPDNHSWQLSGRTEASASNLTIFSQPLNNASLNFEAKNNFLTISTFNITLENGFANLTGTTSLTEFKDISLETHNFPLGVVPFNTMFPKVKNGALSGLVSSKILLTQLNNTLSGEASIVIDNVTLSPYEFKQLNCELSLANSIFTFENLSLSDDYSFLKSSGQYNTVSEMLILDFLPDSLIDFRDIPFVNLYDLEIDGAFSLDGRLSYVDQEFFYQGTQSSKSINLFNAKFKNLKLDVELSKQSIIINKFESKLDNGSVTLLGNITKDDDQHYTFNISPSFYSFPLEKLENITMLLSAINDKPFSSVSDANEAFKISSPFIDQTFIPIFTPTPFQSESTFINSLVQNSKLVINEPSLLNTFLYGKMTGQLSIEGSTESLPLLDGSIKIQQFNSSFFNAPNINFDFKKDNKSTHYSFKSKDFIINDNSIEDLLIEGSYTNDFLISLNKNLLTYNSKTIKNILTGNIHYQSNKQNSLDYPVDLYVNLTEENSSILSILYPKVSKIDYYGDLLLNIGGTSLNPIMNLLLNTENALDITLSPKDNETIGTSYQVLLDPLNIDDNNVSFTNLSINEINTSGEKELLLKSQSNGTLKLKGLDFTSTPYLLSSVNFTIDSDPQTIESTILNGNVDFNNTRFLGNIITPLGSSLEKNMYTELDIAPATFFSDISINNAELFLPQMSSSGSKLDPFLFNLDINIDIEENVFFGGPIFGNSFFGASADLEFSPTLSPLQFQGNLNSLAITNEISIESGTLSILNQSFKLLSPTDQQLYSKNDTILPNTISMKNNINESGDEIVSPILTLRSLCIIENDITSTENTSLQYTHIVLSINDVLNNLQKISFDVYESNTDSPKNISELTHIQQFEISNQAMDYTNNIDKTSSSDLLKLLLPDLYVDPSSDQILSTIGESGLNNIIRRSIMRPLEKNISQQIGINDLIIDYNVGKKIIQDADDTLGIQMIKNIFSDRLVIRLTTEMELVGSEESEENFEVSEIELSYYLLKNKNLSINYSNYKSTFLDNTYLSKLSMRYDYEY